MDPVSVLRSVLDEAHQALADTASDVTPEQARWIPPGKALPIGALFAHAMLSEDGLIAWLKGAPPLFATSYAGRTGLDEHPPLTPPWDDWSRRVKVDLDALREYSRAVFAATDAYVAALTPEDLDYGVVVDDKGTSWSQVRLLGSIPRHISSHAGEISCLKGLQGARGYLV
jgi:hypothetical protein